MLSMLHPPVLVVSDLHFTDNPADQYRWDLLQQIIEVRPRTLLILGDLTDAKDRHPASLVHKIVSFFKELELAGIVVVCLVGNHDYTTNPEKAFFRFLPLLVPGKIRWVDTMSAFDGGKVWMLPHTRTPREDWEGIDGFRAAEVIFMHQTVPGSIASNGQEMEGEDVGPLPPVPIYSGDIHVPQRVGTLTYVGTPYHVHFGDTYQPRGLLFFGKWSEYEEIHFDFPRKFVLTVSSVEELEEVKINPGDQVKLRLHLRKSDFSRWDVIRKETADRVESTGAHLRGLELIRTPDHKVTQGDAERLVKASKASPRDVLIRFSALRSVPEPVREAGERFL